jgi:tetratricopeptide (TPR) repeat protein
MMIEDAFVQQVEALARLSSGQAVTLKDDFAVLKPLSPERLTVELFWQLNDPQAWQRPGSQFDTAVELITALARRALEAASPVQFSRCWIPLRGWRSSLKPPVRSKPEIYGPRWVRCACCWQICWPAAWARWARCCAIWATCRRRASTWSARWRWMKPCSGEEHPFAARDANDLGVVLLSAGDASGARRLHERALALDRRAFGEAHPAVARDLANLAEALRSLGEYPAARQAAERRCDIFEAVLGGAHPVTGTVLNNLGHIFQQQGDLKPAAKPLTARW